MVWEQDADNVFAIRLSTGYEVDVDLTKTSRAWLPHLARAIIGERFLSDSKAAHEWRPEVIVVELRYLLVAIPPEHKDAILGQVIWDAVMKVYKKLEKRAAEQAESTGQESDNT